MIKTSVLVVSILIITFFVIYGLQKQENNNYYKRAIVLIDKIEAFKYAEKRLLNNVNELGLEENMNDGPYYEKKDSISYMIFFNIGFDNIRIYHSDKKE